MDADPAEAVRPHLLSGEHVLWAGRPNPLRLLNAQDVFMVPFSLVWGGLVTYAWLPTLLSHPSSAFSPVGIFFFVIGQYLIWGRLVVKGWNRIRTVYAVTDQRVMSVTGSSNQSMALRGLPPMTCSSRRDGTESIVFGSANRTWDDNGMGFSRRASAALAFRDIPDVDRVCRLIAERGVTTESY
jgi:hypothetical protein